LERAASAVRYGQVAFGSMFRIACIGEHPYTPMSGERERTCSTEDEAPLFEQIRNVLRMARAAGRDRAADLRFVCNVHERRLWSTRRS